MVYTLEKIRPKIIIECEERHIRGFAVHDVFKFILEKNYNGYFYYEGEKKSISKFDINRDQLDHLKRTKKLDNSYIANFIFEPIS